MSRQSNTNDETPGKEPDETGSRKVAAPGRTRQLVTGAAIGIGSAALVAALLYANRGRKNDKNRA
jgi:hypothetical protein